MIINRNYVENLVIVTAVLLSYSFIPDYGSMLPKLIVFFTLFLSLSVLFKNKFESGEVEYCLRYSFFILIFLIFIMSYHQRWGEFSFVLKVIIAYFMVLTIKIDYTFELLCKLSKVLLAPTLLAMFLGSQGYVFNVTNLLSDGRELYLTPLLTSQKEIYFTRASSYFWEPGVFAFVVNLVIAYKLFRKGLSLNSIIVELIYLLIAQSAGGVISFLLLLFAYFLKIKKDKLIEVFVLFLIVAFLFVLFLNLESNIGFLTNTLNIFTMFFLDRDLLDDASFAARIVDFYVPFYAALENPFLGAKDLNVFMMLSDSIRGFSADGITNSWSSIAYRYGYPFMILYLIFVYVGTSRYFDSLIIPFVFIILLASSPVYLNIMTLYLIFSMSEAKLSTKKLYS